MAICPGSLISHVGGIVAGCTLDGLDDDARYVGLELRHDVQPKIYWQVYGGCEDCGIDQGS
jgi:hypothetical protein